MDGFVEFRILDQSNAVDNSGHSIYNALLISLRHNAKAIFRARWPYTYSHVNDQGTGYFNQFDQESAKRSFTTRPTAALCRDRHLERLRSAM